MTTEDDDLATCEGCGAKHAWDETRSTDDGCWECPRCQAAGDEAFKNCAHAWEPMHNSHGEASQYCPRCIHIVTNEDFVRMFPSVPLAEPQP